MRLIQPTRTWMLLCICLLLQLPAFAKSSPLIDSLKSVLTELPDTARVKVLGDIFWEYRVISLDSSRVYAFRELNEAEEIGYDYGIGQGLNDVGLIYHFGGDFDSAVYWYDSSLVVRTAIDDKKGMAALFNKLALILYERARYNEFLELNQQALDFYEELDDTMGMSITINNIGDAHFALGDFKTALEKHYLSLSLRTSGGDTAGIAASYLNIANVHHRMADTATALEFYLKAEQLFAVVGDNEHLGKARHNVALIQQLYGQYESALETALKALENKRTSNMTFQKVSTLMLIGDLYTDLGKGRESYRYLHEALALCREIDFKDDLDHAYHYMARYHHEFGNKDSAYLYQKWSTLQKMDNNREEMQRTVAEMETRYETEKKEQENELLRTENLLTESELQRSRARLRTQLVVGLLLLILGLAGFLAWRSRTRLAQEQKLAEQEKLRFKAVIEAEEKERTRIARELHDGLGQILSTAKLNVASLEDGVDAEDTDIWNNSIQLIDEAVTEVRAVSHNLMPTALIKYGLTRAMEELVGKINEAKLLKVVYQAEGLDDSKLEQSTQISIYRIVQEVLNNMIKHSKADTITVNIRQVDDKVFLQISDNGIGFDTSKIDQSQGIGWKNIFSRVSMLKGFIDIDSKPGKGTSINISIAT